MKILVPVIQTAQGDFKAMGKPFKIKNTKFLGPNRANGPGFLVDTAERSNHIATPVVRTVYQN